VIANPSGRGSPFGLNQQVSTPKPIPPRISEEIGAAKPHAAFFEIAHEQTGHPPKSEILVIGDSLSSDIRGGIGFGVDTCWFNPNGDPRPDGLAITYEIQSLRELI